MLSPKSMLIASLISLFALAGCNNTEQSATQKPITTSPASQTSATSPAKTNQIPNGIIIRSSR
jgi:uncharacterized lipoprotein YajG